LTFENNGVPAKGMESWKQTFSPTEIKNIASIVLSLQGNKPANAKAPQGNLYTLGKGTGTANIKKVSHQTRQLND
jgi:hypothetical protein